MIWSRFQTVYQIINPSTYTPGILVSFIHKLNLVSDSFYTITIRTGTWWVLIRNSSLSLFVLQLPFLASAEWKADPKTIGTFVLWISTLYTQILHSRLTSSLSSIWSMKIIMTTLNYSDSKSARKWKGILIVFILVTRLAFLRWRCMGRYQLTLNQFAKPFRFWVFWCRCPPVANLLWAY